MSAITRNPTTVLWFGNALGMALLLLAAAYRFGGLLPGMGAQFPQVRPLPALPVSQPAARADIGDRNPFDSSAVRWKASGESKSAMAGELRGVILLPGLQAVVTNSGTVRSGEMLPEGRIVRILDDKIIVEQGGGNREVKLPSADRPTLRSLSKAGAAENKINKGNK